MGRKMSDVWGNWAALHKEPHFILWGKLNNIPNGKLVTASMVITEREPGGLVVYRRDEVPYNLAIDGIDNDAYKQLFAILLKFERLWPCTFLAKEYKPDDV
jgi:hypothetical protein